MLDNLHYEDYAPHRLSKFQLGAQGKRWEIESVEVEEKSPSAHQEQFVLTFRAPLDAPPFQSIFTLEHATLGEGAPFLIPVGRTAAGLFYEATVNRPR